MTPKKIESEVKAIEIGYIHNQKVHPLKVQLHDCLEGVVLAYYPNLAM